MILSVFYLLAFSFRLILTASVPNTISHKTTIYEAPEILISHISEYIGADNQLPCACLHFHLILSEIHPIHEFVSKILGIPELSQAPGVNSDVLNLLKLPKFECNLTKEKYLVSEIIDFGKYKSIKSILLSHCLELLAGLDKSAIFDEEPYFTALLRDHGDLNLILQYLKLFKRKQRKKIMNRFLIFWNPNQRADFFNQIREYEDDQGKGLIESLLKLVSPKILVPYLICENIPSDWWIESFLSLDPFDRINTFSDFVICVALQLNTDQVDRFEAFWLEHVPAVPEYRFESFIVEAYMNFNRNPDCCDQIISSLKNLNLNQEYYPRALFDFAVSFNAVKIVDYLIRNSSISDFDMDHKLNFYLSQNTPVLKDRNIAFSIKMFLLFAIDFIDNPHTEYNLSEIFKAVFTAFQVDSANFNYS